MKRFFTFHFPVRWAKALETDTLRPTLGTGTICELGSWKLRRSKLQRSEVSSARAQGWCRRDGNGWSCILAPQAASTAGREGIVSDPCLGTCSFPAHTASLRGGE